MNDDQKRERFATAAKWAIGLGGALAFSVIALKVIAGIVGFVAAFVLGSVSLALGPVFSRKLANWKYKLQVNEAKENPIETRRNNETSARARLEAAKSNISKMKAELSNFHDMIKKIVQEDGEEAAKASKDTYDTLAAKIDKMVEKVEEGYEELDAHMKETGRLEREIEMAMAGERLKGLMGEAEEKVMQRILSDVASRAVKTRLNTIVADLEMMDIGSSSKKKPAAAITNQPSNVIDITPKSVTSDIHAR
jgi:hypothetical protein